MAYLDDLIDRRNAITHELSALNKSAAGGLPNILNSEGGVDSDHHQYKMGLYDELEKINARIKEEAEVQAQLSGEGNAFEIDSEGTSEGWW